MKLGDKVRFLSTTGGGVVKGFKGKDIVLVEDEDGFEVPTLINECVVIDTTGNKQAKVIPQQAELYVKQSQAVIVETETVKETKEGEQLNVCLAYIPLDEKKLSDTGYECYLVNDSNYFLMFNYSNRVAQGWESRFSGIIEPNTKLLIDEFGKQDLNDLEKICVQLLAYKKNKPYAIKNTYSVELRIDTVKFFKLHSFKENEFFEDNALLYPIVKRDLAEKELIIDPHVLEQAMFEKKVIQEPARVVDKKAKGSIIEVDLHIDQLLDNTNGLSPKDMLDYQLHRFRDIMNENKQNKGQRIVFIHGKGDGILKNAILKEIQVNYSTVYYQDASFREYGYGATMITIK